MWGDRAFIHRGLCEIERWVIYCNPSSISTGGALYLKGPAFPMPLAEQGVG